MAGVPDFYMEKFAAETDYGYKSEVRVRSDAKGSDQTVDLATLSCFYHADDGSSYSFDVTYEEGLLMYMSQLKAPIDAPKLKGFSSMPGFGWTGGAVPVCDGAGGNEDKGAEATPTVAKRFQKDSESLQEFVGACGALARKEAKCTGFVLHAPRDSELLQIVDGRFWVVFKAAGAGAKPVKRDAKWGQTWYSKDVRSG